MFVLFFPSRDVRFFREEPAAKAIFGFHIAPSGGGGSSGSSIDDDCVYESRQFLEVAKNLIEIVDQAVDMLGPDLQVLAEVLIELGEKYRKEYGMKEEHYPALGRALLDQLEEMLGPQGWFGIHTKSCWLQVYGALAADITALEVQTAAASRKQGGESVTSDRASTASSPEFHQKRCCCPKRRT